MIIVKKKAMEAVVGATRKEELYASLQEAIELEHATIPLYLTGYYSIKEGHNQVAAQLMRSVVIEEMLHMTIAANVLNAIGGTPAINKAKFVPEYPATLPLTDPGHLIVHLLPISKEQLKSAYMAIEEPEDPLEFPVIKTNLAAPEHQHTIGEFYTAIKEKIRELGECIFVGDPKKQVVCNQWYDRKDLFAVTDVSSASRAIDVIISQGEGSGNSPLDVDHQLAHYYKFSEIYHGKRLVKDPNEAKGYSYSGEAIPLDSDGIYDLVPNPKASDYEPGTFPRQLMDQFNDDYSRLLNCLEQTFNQEPSTINDAIGIMYSLRIAIKNMAQYTCPKTKKVLAPSYEFNPNVD